MPSLSRSGAAAPSSRGREGLLAFAVLALFTLAAYAPALGGTWLWDDLDWIGQVQKGARGSWNGLARVWLAPHELIQFYPLTYSSWWLDRALTGLDTRWMHVENVLLHAGTAAFAVLVLRELRVPGAFFAGAIFALHPVHCETVAWLVERKNVLSGVLFLAALYLWLRFDGDPRRPRALYWLAVFTFALALLAKTATLMLPIGQLLLVAWRRKVRRSDLSELAPFFLLAISSAVVTLQWERAVGAVGEEWSLTLPERCLVAGRAVWFYLGKLVLPVRLAFVYPPWSPDPSDPAQWLPLAGLALLLGLAWRWRPVGNGGPDGKGGPLVAAAWFVAMLLPVLGFFDFYYMRYAFVADHFQYLASLGPIALGAAALCAARSRWLPGHLSAALGLGLLLLLGALTWRQAHAYRDEESLWRATLANSPDAWMAHTNYGNLLFERGEEAQSIAHHERAVALHPRAYESNNALGSYHARKGEFDAARAYLDAALAARPEKALAWHNLGALESMRGDHAAAIEAFRQALLREPERVDVMLSLAALLIAAEPRELRDPATAVSLVERALRDPSQRTLEHQDLLFTAYATSGRRAEALAAGAEALSMAEARGEVELAGRIRERLRIVEAWDQE